MNQMEHFRYIIAEERKRKGLTQEALATRLGITPQAISKWENGVGYPDVTLFPVIAEVLGISVARLFGEAETRPSRTGKLPESYSGMDFVLASGEYVCYAAKAVREADEKSGIVRFSDGSESSVPSTPTRAICSWAGTPTSSPPTFTTPLSACMRSSRPAALPTEA